MKKTIAQTVFGLIAPAGLVEPEKLKNLLIQFDKYHIKYKLADNVLSQSRYLAGSIEARLADLYQIYEDPSVDAVWCLRGGYGSAQLIPWIDWTKIPNQKPLIGYSDITALLTNFAQNGKSAIHALVGLDLLRHSSQKPRYDIDSALSSLEAALNGHIEAFSFSKVEDLNITGVTFGGNLTVLASLAGTPSALALKEPSILLLEDVHEALYRLERSFYQLSHTSTFHWVKAIGLGDFTPLTHSEKQVFETIVKSYIPDRSVPVFFGLPIGHGAQNYAWPINQKAHILGNTLSWQ